MLPDDWECLGQEDRQEDAVPPPTCLPYFAWGIVCQYLDTARDLHSLTSTCSSLRSFRSDWSAQAMWLLQHKQEDTLFHTLTLADPELRLQLMQKLLDLGPTANAMGPGVPGLASCIGRSRDHSLLYHLAKEGDVAAIDTLLKHGADPEISTFSALFAAAQGGHSGVVRLLAAAGVSPCASGPLTGTGGSQKRVFESQWESALFAASARGHTEVVQVLLDAGAKMERIGSLPGGKLNWLEDLDCNSHKSSPLHVACFHGHLEVVKLLAAPTFKVRPAQVNHALHFVCKHGQADALEGLVSAGASLESGTSTDPASGPLHTACRCNNPRAVEKLIALGACIDARDRGGRTPLGILCSSSSVAQAVGTAGGSSSSSSSGISSGAAAVDSSGSGSGCNSESVRVILAAQVGSEEDRRQLRWALILACSSGNEAAAQELLSAKAFDMETCTDGSEGTSAMHEACREGRVSLVELLLSHGVDPNTRDCFGSTPLMLVSAHSGGVPVAKILLSAGAHVGASYRDGATGGFPVAKILLSAGAHVGASYRDGATGGVPVAKLLLPAGAHVGASYRDGATALYAPENICSLNSRIEAHGGASCSGGSPAPPTPHKSGSLNTSSSPSKQVEFYSRGSRRDGSSALHAAQRIGSLNTRGEARVGGSYCDGGTALHAADTICSLSSRVDAHVGASYRDGGAIYCDGSTALHAAARAGCMDVVELLLSYKAPVSSADLEGTTPLHEACEAGQAAVAQRLMRAGASLNAVGAGGNTPLLVATHALARGSGVVDLILGLIYSNADVGAANHAGDTPLHHACSAGDSKDHLGMVKALISARAPVGAATTSGVTPLHVACRGGLIKVVKLLLAARAPFGPQADCGSSPLHMACRGQFPDIVKSLVAAGAAVNMIDGSSSTPLHIACREGDAQVVGALLKAGAALDVCDGDGHSPIELATNRRHTQVMKLLAAKAKMGPK